jgi:hypothetical protein
LLQQLALLPECSDPGAWEGIEFSDSLLPWHGEASEAFSISIPTWTVPVSSAPEEPGMVLAHSPAGQKTSRKTTAAAISGPVLLYTKRRTYKYKRQGLQLMSIIL